MAQAGQTGDGNVPIINSDINGILFRKGPKEG